MKSSKKKGSNGTNAAVLIALIATVIVLYIIFLNPDDRATLLGEPNHSQGSSNNAGGLEDRDNVTFLYEKPGRVDYIDRDKIEKTIPSFYLFRSVNAAEIASFNQFIVKKGWFDDQSQSFSFTIDDLKNTNNVILSLTNRKSNGLLKVIVNDQIVFEGDTPTTPIQIDKKILDFENTLTFSTNDVGWKFWTTNEYQVTSAKIIADITDDSRQKSENKFILTREEFENVETAKLKFFPTCTPNQVGPLEIRLNEHIIFRNVPDCDSINIQEFSQSVLIEQDNYLSFKTDEGSYLIDQIMVNIDLEEPVPLIYYFDVTNEELEDLEDDYDSNLTIIFTDDEEYKRGELFINGRKVYMSTRKRIYSLGIDSYLQTGNNYIKLVPKTQLDIVELKVEAVKD